MRRYNSLMTQNRVVLAVGSGKKLYYYGKIAQQLTAKTIVAISIILCLRVCFNLYTTYRSALLVGLTCKHAPYNWGNPQAQPGPSPSTEDWNGQERLSASQGVTH